MILQNLTTPTSKFWTLQNLLRMWQFPGDGGQFLAKQNLYAVHYGMTESITIAQRYCMPFILLHSAFITVTRKSGRLRKKMMAMTTTTTATTMGEWASTAASPPFKLDLSVVDHLPKVYC